MTDPIAQALAIAPVEWLDGKCRMRLRKGTEFVPWSVEEVQSEACLYVGPIATFTAHALFVAGQMQRLVSKGWKVELTAFAVGGWRARIDICECEAPTPALALAELVCKIGESK